MVYADIPVIIVAMPTLDSTITYLNLYVWYLVFNFHASQQPSIIPVITFLMQKPLKIVYVVTIPKYINMLPIIPKMHVTVISSLSVKVKIMISK